MLCALHSVELWVPGLLLAELLLAAVPVPRPASVSTFGGMAPQCLLASLPAVVPTCITDCIMVRSSDFHSLMCIRVMLSCKCLHAVQLSGFVDNLIQETVITTIR